MGIERRADSERAAPSFHRTPAHHWRSHYLGASRNGPSCNRRTLHMDARHWCAIDYGDNSLARRAAPAGHRQFRDPAFHLYTEHDFSSSRHCRRIHLGDSRPARPQRRRRTSLDFRGECSLYGSNIGHAPTETEARPFLSTSRVFGEQRVQSYNNAAASCSLGIDCAKSIRSARRRPRERGRRSHISESLRGGARASTPVQNFAGSVVFDDRPARIPTRLSDVKGALQPGLLLFRVWAERSQDSDP